MVEVYCTIKDGKIEMDRGFLRKYIERLSDGVYKISICSAGNRSDESNRLYWTRNEILALELGYTKDSLHNYLMERCEFGKRISIGGKEYFVRESSRELTQSEFSKLFVAQDELANFISEELLLPE